MSDDSSGGRVHPKRFLAAALTVALLVMAAGCATRPAPPPGAERAAAPMSEAAADPDARVEPPLVEEPEEPAPAGSRSQIFEGSGEFIDQKAASRRRPAAEDEGEVVFNFEGQPIQEVVKAILGDLLEQNYVIAPGISGNVTFSTANPIPRSQALAVLELLLSWNNAAMVFFDGRYHVVPNANAIPGQLTPTTAPLAGQRGFEVRAFQLQYLAPAEMQKLLEPYARESAFVSVDNARGLLVLAGTRQELENYRQTIKIFDVDWLEGMSIGIYPIERVEAELVAGELETVFGEGSGTPLAGMFRFLPVERINSVIVITPQPQYLEKAAEWIGRLDRGGESAGTRLYVYKVKNVKATDLADTLNDVFGSGRTSSRGRGGAAVDPFAPGLETGEITSINDPRRRAREQREQEQRQREQPAPSTGDGRGGVALVDGEDIRITAVEEQNSLLVRATPQQYDSVLDAIKRLDIEPLQVLIEVMILEVTLNDSLNYGVQWFFENAVNSLDPDPFGGGSSGGNGGNGGLQISGLFDSDAPISPDRFGSITGTGLSYAIRGGDTAAFVDLLQTYTDVRAIAAPSMLVLNNREANINVGTQIPVTSNVFSTGTGSNLGASRVQFRDTGVTLNVVPRVNPGGMVFMEVAQEVSAPGARIGDNFAVSQRRLDTEVAVQSGETVVLGGLIQINDSKTKSGVPGLSRIPIIGGLFGTQGTELMRTELLVMITPLVVANMDQAREVSDQYRKKMEGLEPLDLERLRTGIKLPGWGKD